MVESKGQNVLDLIYYSDEAWFHLSGFINSQNCRIWSSDNPLIFNETPLHAQKIGVWVAMSRARIIGPIFFNETINSQNYCDNILRPFIAEFGQFERENAFFQQDGATAHTANNTMHFLKQCFEDRIISKDLWPPRSPDLSPPDFYLWGSAKNSVFKENPKTLEDLQTAIRNHITSIQPQTLQNVFRNMCRRVDVCLQNQGGHFQHML